MMLKPLFKSLFHKDPDSSTNSEENDVKMDLENVNCDILEAIFIRLEKKDLISLKLVCKNWKKILDQRSFWLTKEEYDGDNYLESLINSGKSFLDNNYGKLSILQPYERNLLKNENPNARQLFAKHADERWMFSRGGNDWAYEEPPTFFANRFDVDFQPLFDSCLSTSYETCGKTMDLVLSKIGIDDNVMDNHRPPITFTEWVSHRSDCGSLYKMILILYDKDNKCIASEQQDISFVQWANQKWHKMEITLKSYPPGGRVLRVHSAGRDTQFWAGHYGTKIAGSQLVVSMEDTPPSTGNSTVVAPGSALGRSRYQPLE